MALASREAGGCHCASKVVSRVGVRCYPGGGGDVAAEDGGVKEAR